MTNNVKKVCLIGDSTVGKSALLNRYIHDKFTDQYTKTIGIDFGLKLENTEQGELRIQLWDIAGDDQFKKITEPHFLNARFNILMFDVNRQSTFDNLNKWLESIKNFGNDNIPTVLVGSQIDKDKRQVTEESAQKFCIDNRLVGYIEISNKDGTNIKELFKIIVQCIIEEDDIIQTNGDDLNSPLLGKKKKKSVACTKCCVIL